MGKEKQNYSMLNKKKIEIIESIAQEYRRACFAIGRSETKEFFVKENSDGISVEKKLEYMKNYKKLVDDVLNNLNEEYRNIIINDFLNGYGNGIYKQNWWVKIYSRSTYYRYKYKAIDTFLDFINIF